MKKTDKLNDYDAFVDKFKPKRTTDDCYTPPAVYEAIRGWAMKKFNIAPDRPIVRPFYPGGDFEHYDYPQGCVVIDNPPFSILAKIKRFYLERGIQFFIFAQSLTLLSTAHKSITHIITNSPITYENGAKVNTAFITNLPSPYALMTAPDLAQLIKEADNQRPKVELPVLDFPPNVVTSARLNKIASYVSFRVRRTEARFVRTIGKERKELFGGGLLISSAKAAEAAEAAKAAKAVKAVKYELTPEEQAIVAELDKQG
ncbi:chromosome partitioning protein ParB [Prevotellamassilia timonensis]|uniref:chromosome partitioning protein ParB n=1 Tax=Prevotellamassilia timonensis TaxID=1852370 RepID=UPI003079F372